MLVLVSGHAMEQPARVRIGGFDQQGNVARGRHNSAFRTLQEQSGFPYEAGSAPSDEKYKQSVTFYTISSLVSTQGRLGWQARQKLPVSAM